MTKDSSSAWVVERNHIRHLVGHHREWETKRSMYQKKFGPLRNMGRDQLIAVCKLLKIDISKYSNFIGGRASASAAAKRSKKRPRTEEDDLKAGYSDDDIDDVTSSLVTSNAVRRRYDKTATGGRSSLAGAKNRIALSNSNSDEDDLDTATVYSNSSANNSSANTSPNWDPVPEIQNIFSFPGSRRGSLRPAGNSIPASPLTTTSSTESSNESSPASTVHHHHHNNSNSISTLVKTTSTVSCSSSSSSSIHSSNRLRKSSSSSSSLSEMNFMMNEECLGKGPKIASSRPSKALKSTNNHHNIKVIDATVPRLKTEDEKRRRSSLSEMEELEKVRVVKREMQVLKGGEGLADKVVKRAMDVLSGSEALKPPRASADGRASVPLFGTTIGESPSSSHRSSPCESIMVDDTPGVTTSEVSEAAGEAKDQLDRATSPVDAAITLRNMRSDSPPDKDCGRRTRFRLIRQASTNPLAGDGLFLAGRAEEGDLLCAWGGRELSAREAKDSASPYMIIRDDGVILDGGGDVRNGMGQFINHSRRLRNVEFIPHHDEENRPMVLVRALRTVENCELFGEYTWWDSETVCMWEATEGGRRMYNMNRILAPAPPPTQPPAPRPHPFRLW